MTHDHYIHFILCIGLGGGVVMQVLDNPLGLESKIS